MTRRTTRPPTRRSAVSSSWSTHRRDDARDVAARVLPRAGRARHRGAAARRRRRGLDAHRRRPVEVVPPGRTRASAASSSWSSAATARSCGPPSWRGRRHPAARGQPRPRRLPRRGRVRRRRASPSTRSCTGATPPRSGSRSTSRSTGGQGARLPDLGAQRGQRREGRPRADARGRRRGRRPAAVAVGLRRRRVRDADRLHGLQLHRRRPDRLARGRGPADRADQRARAVRPPDGRGADLGARGRGDRPHRRRRGAVVRRPPHRRPAAGRPHRGTPRRTRRSAWPGSTRHRSPTGWSRSSTCPSRAGAARPSAAGGQTRHAWDD